MNKNKKMAVLLVVSTLLLSLTACDKKPIDNQVETPTPPPTTTEKPNESKQLLVDSKEYRLTFDILGSWTEYAGASEVRESAQAVLSGSTESADNIFFYVLIDKYEDDAELSTKDEIVTEIKSKYDTIEFESINDTSSDNIPKVIAIYTTTQDNNSIKNYQYTLIENGYKISFVYSSPELVYNSQKGYINDMIKSYKFEVKDAEATTVVDVPVASETPKE